MHSVSWIRPVIILRIYIAIYRKFTRLCVLLFILFSIDIICFNCIYNTLLFKLTGRKDFPL